MDKIMPTKDYAYSVDQQMHIAFAKNLLLAGVDDGLFPGGVYGAITPDFEVLIPFGNHTYNTDASSILVDERTFYDVSSVTKSFPTSLLLLRLINQGHICRETLDETLDRYLPEFRGGDSVTIKNLLSFGFELNLASRLELLGGYKEIHTAIMNAGIARSPGNFRYSNSASFIAARLIEKLYQKPYEDAAREFIFEPLSLSGGLLSGKMELSSVAPSEEGSIHGVVHDEFSRHLLLGDGIHSGAAGVFLNGEDGMSILREFCRNNGGRKILGDPYQSLRRFGDRGIWGEMRSNQLNDPEFVYGLGFDILDKEYGPCGCCTEDTVLITGFTGCTIFLQPGRGKGFFLFTNSIYPKRRTRVEGKSPLYELRQKLFHSLQVCKHCLE
jgi:CubicO group peptidase (beta-lactamase class C family)